MSDEALIGEVLATAVKAAKLGRAEPAARMLVPHLARSAEAASSMIAHIPLSHRAGGRSRVVVGLVQAMLEVLTAWRDQGGEIGARMGTLDEVPEPLRTRMIAEHMLGDIDSSRPEVTDFLEKSIRGGRAYPEGLALLRAHGGADEGLAGSLGTPPSSTEVAAHPVDSSFPDGWLRAHSWLVAMPDAVRHEWRNASAIMDARVGKAPTDGRLIGDIQTFSGPNAPFEQDRLAAMSPLEAAALIRAWVPPTGYAPQQSPRGLERQLQEIVKANPAEWSANPIEVVSLLHDPTYIAGYLQGLAASAATITSWAPQLAEAVLVVEAEPWTVEPLSADPFDADQDWAIARASGIRLLGELWKAEADMGSAEPAARELTFAAARRWDDATAVHGDAIDALTAAINRESTKALEVAFYWASYVSSDSLPSEFLDLLDDWLQRTGEDGLEGRAIMAVRLPFLRHYAPEWFAQREADLIGPDGLGPDTFALYVRWCRPTRPLLVENVNAYRDALKNDPKDTLQHLLLGLLWGVQPWDDPAYLIDLLRQEDGDKVSLAGDRLARMVRESTEPKILDRATAFWKAALDSHLPPSQFHGFGWFADVDAMGSGVWMDLTLNSLRISGGDIDWAHSVARRAAGHPTDERALEILERLLSGDVPMWHVREVGEAGLRVLAESQDATLTSNEERGRNRLAETLLEKGFFEAKGLVQRPE